MVRMLFRALQHSAESVIPAARAEPTRSLKSSAQLLLLHSVRSVILNRMIFLPRHCLDPTAVAKTAGTSNSATTTQPSGSPGRCRRGVLVALLSVIGSSSSVCRAVPDDGPVIIGNRNRTPNSPSEIERRSSDSPLSPDAVSTDEWFRIEFDGKHVGHEEIITRAYLSDSYPPADMTPADNARSGAASTGNSEHNPTRLRRIRRTQLRLKRFGKDLSVSANLETVESPDGVLYEWTLRRNAGDGSSMERSGKWLPESAAYEVSELVQATRRVSTLTSPRPVQSTIITGWFPQSSMKSDRRFNAPVLFPETNSITSVHFGTSSQQSLQLPDGRTLTVRRMEFWPDVEPNLRTSLFVDEQGNVLRSEQLLLGSPLTLVRTDAADAIGRSGQEAIDLDLTGVIAVRRPIANIDSRPNLHLRITLPPGELLTVPQGDYQKIVAVRPGEVIVALTRPPRASAATDPRPIVPVTNAAAKYLAKTRWLDFDNLQVNRTVRQAGSGITAVETCRRMTRHLSVNLRRSVFSTALLPASNVAKRMSGDCTEHAVLLAAMMRSRGIPSRIAVGLIYVEKVGAFAAHMWTEALIDGIWMPFDSAVGADNFGVTHLKLVDSALEDQVESGMLLFLPLVQLIGRTTIESVSESDLHSEQKR